MKRRARSWRPETLTREEVKIVRHMINTTDLSSNAIAELTGLRPMQIAAIKAWRTMGKY